MHIIIPVKPFSQSKTRLAAVLSARRRTALSRQLLARTVALAVQVGPVVVVSRSRAVREQAKRAGAWALVESQRGLNAAVRQGIQWVQARGGSAVLILPADLPLLTLADLQMLAAPKVELPAVRLAPCRRKDGTNALALWPPGAIIPNFGPGSFARHTALARAAGIDPQIYRSSTVAFDLDVPDDWAHLRVVSGFTFGEKSTYGHPPR